MLTESVILTIIAIIILLIFAFLIHLCLEKDVKRASLFVSLLVITLFLGVLVDNLIGSTPVDPVPNTHNTSEESDTVIDDTSVVSVDDSTAIEDHTGKGSDSSGDNSRKDGDDSRSVIRRIIDILSPATKPFAGKINKACFPDSELFIWIIFINVTFLFFVFECVDRPCPLWVFALVPFILIINSYIYYITTFFISTFSIVDDSIWIFFINAIVYLLITIIAMLEAALIGRLTELSNKEYS